MKEPNTKIGQDMFTAAKKVIRRNQDKYGASRLDWSEVFSHLLVNYQYDLEEIAGFEGFVDSLTPRQQRELEDRFLEKFNEIEIEDTLYDEVRNGKGLKAVTQVAAEVDIWTRGDNINSIQKTYLLRSKIYTLIHQSIADIGLPTRCNDIVHDDKATRIPDSLEYFIQGREVKEIIVAVYDDKPDSLQQANMEIDTWRKKRQQENKPPIQVHPLFIRAIRGSHAQTPWPDDYPLPKIEAQTLYDVAAAIELEAKNKKIPRENIIAYLDFDGAMSDNRLMKTRQAQVMHSQIMKALKLATYQYIQAQYRKETKEHTKPDIQQLIKKYKDDVWDIYDLIVKPPHQTLMRILRAIEIHTGKPLDRQTIETLREIDTYMQNMGYMNPKFTAKDMREYYLEMSKEVINGEKVEKPSWSYNGSYRFRDTSYMFNPSRTKEDRMIELLLDDKEREKAAIEAEKFRTKYLAWICEIKNPSIRYKDGGLKAIPSLFHKMLKEAQSGNLDALNLIHDLVRGFIEVQGAGYDSSYTEMDYTVGRFMTGIKDQIVAFDNYYQHYYRQDSEGKPDRPLMGFKITFKLTDEIPFEIQIQTRNAAAVGRLNHDTTFKKKVPLSPTQIDYILKISWTAHIRDLEEAQGHLIEEQKRQERANEQYEMRERNRRTNQEYDDPNDQDNTE